MDDPSNAVAPVVEFLNISKSFVPGQPVLRDVSLEILPGEVHGLAGANGSGKSTLVKILAGYHKPDSGQVLVGGRPLALPIRPQQVREAGVRFVHQEKGFVAGMSVLDNMCLGRGYSTGFGWKIKWREEIRLLKAELDRHNVVADLHADAGDLSVATRAKLAIVRALYGKPGERRRVIVLDEATAAMAGDEAASMGTWLRELAQREALGVLFICHRMEELQEVSDRVSVLREGALVTTLSSSSTTSEEILEALVGGAVGDLYPPQVGPSDRREAVLSIEHVNGATVRDVSFSLMPGEILGVTGVQGSGFEEVPYLVYDPERARGGRMKFDGEIAPLGGGTITERMRRGLAMVPADRARNGLALELTLRENLAQPRLRQFRRMGLLRLGAERADAGTVIGALRVVPSGTETRASSMSGGNQQKVLMGKWLATAPSVLLLHEPTEGIDVPTKREIFRIMREQAEGGTASVFASLEYEDLANTCDRIVVLGNGSVKAELVGSEVSGDDVMREAYAASLSGRSDSNVRAKWHE